MMEYTKKARRSSLRALRAKLLYCQTVEILSADAGQTQTCAQGDDAAGSIFCRIISTIVSMCISFFITKARELRAFVIFAHCLYKRAAKWYNDDKGLFN